MDTIAVIGKLIVNKFRLMGRLLTECKPFNGARVKRLGDYTLNLISITNPYVICFNSYTKTIFD